MKYETYVAYRDKANLNDYKISKATGIPKSTFSGWKDGLYTPKMEKQIAIAGILNIPLDVVSEPDTTRDKRRLETEKVKGTKEGGA